MIYTFWSHQEKHIFLLINKLTKKVQGGKTGIYIFLIKSPPTKKVEKKGKNNFNLFSKKKYGHTVLNGDTMGVYFL